MKLTMTLKQANDLGWNLVRGAYSGTNDDRIDRWYWQHAMDSIVDRRGAGFATQEEALQQLAYDLAEE